MPSFISRLEGAEALVDMEATIMKMAILALGFLISLSIVVAQPSPSSLPEGAMVHRDLSYVLGGHARQKLDLY